MLLLMDEYFYSTVFVAVNTSRSNYVQFKRKSIDQFLLTTAKNVTINISIRPPIDTSTILLVQNNAELISFFVFDYEQRKRDFLLFYCNNLPQSTWINFDSCR